MGGRGKKSAKGIRSKPKRVAKKVACIDNPAVQPIVADPWIGLRYVHMYMVVRNLCM